MTKLLLEKGANPRALDKRTQTPLHYAAQKGYAEIVKTILEKDPGVIHICNRVNETPLHLATGGDRLKLDFQTIQLLAEAAGVDTINNKENIFGHTALHHIYYYCSPYIKNQKIVSDVISCLMRNGADSSIKNGSNKTSEELALERGFSLAFINSMKNMQTRAIYCKKYHHTLNSHSI